MAAKHTLHVALTEPLDKAAVAYAQPVIAFTHAEVVDGTGAQCGALTGAVARAVALARARAGVTCARCGKAGRLRLDRPTWPAIRCDEHAVPPHGRSRR